MKPADADVIRAKTHQWLIENPMTPNDDPMVYVAKVAAIVKAHEAEAAGGVPPSLPAPPAATPRTPAA